MHEISTATPLYEFLRLCNENPLPKMILDCGAGHAPPKISLFCRYGYEAYGLELLKGSMAEATDYLDQQKLTARYVRGNMRDIPFADSSFSFVYSYNSIMFMRKPDIEIAVSEIIRVLRPGGLCFVNFESVDDPDDFPFRKDSQIRLLLGSDRFAKHEDDEADVYFESLQILRKEKRIFEKLYEGEMIKQAYIDYIARKE